MFVTKAIEPVIGKQQFKQLVIIDEHTKLEDTNGEKVEMKNIQAKIDSGELEIDGILDEYENNLQKKYASSFKRIIAIMNRVANNEPVPDDKFKEITPNGEHVKEYEFKYQDLRVYAIKIRNGQLILLGGFKNKQSKNISRFRSLKKQYLEIAK